MENLDEMVEDLKSKGLKFHGVGSTFNDPAAENTQGTFKNIKWIYFQTPWGMDIDLVEYL